MAAPRHSSQSSATTRFVSPTHEYDAQFLDNAGRAEKTIYFSQMEMDNGANLTKISTVLATALRKLAPGVAMYVNDLGIEATPW
jgi:hypothetical protein